MKKTTAPVKYGQRLYGPFSITVFNSRNTSYEYTSKFAREDQARLFTKHKSVPFKAILTDSRDNWIEYENGVITSWSVDLGTDKIPE